LLPELAHVDGKTFEIPFDAHQKLIALAILVFVGVQNISVRAENEISDRRGKSPLVSTTDEQYSATFQSVFSKAACGIALRPILRRKLTRLSRNFFKSPVFSRLSRPNSIPGVKYLADSKETTEAAAISPR
jgi:hypothetical protein